MKPVIAVPYFPGSNGDVDAINRVAEAGMKPLPLYFHMGDEKRLAENAMILAEQVDGAVLPGGFPYEDRIDFGLVPAKITYFADAMRKLVDSGKPVIAFCSGNQIAHAMGLAFPKGSPHKVSLLPNICDRGGELVYHRFRDDEVYARLVCDPQRTAFTRHFKPGEHMPDIIDHGGGRFRADASTLHYLLANGQVVTRYCDKDGNVVDDFPTNPNGSMLNIESVTNQYGNLKLGMCHNERKLNALRQGRANIVFQSMREYIEDNCPDLSGHARPQGADIPMDFKDYSYLTPQLDPARTIDIYVKMLTDDNERMTAQLFLGEGVDIDRRRLIRLEVAEEYATDEGMKEVLVEIASMDALDGIMLKKDLPSVTRAGSRVHTYEVVDTDEATGAQVRAFTEHDSIVDGFPVVHEEISLPNPLGYITREQMWENEKLRQAVTNVHAGRVWFFPDEASKQKALTELLD